MDDVIKIDKDYNIDKLIKTINRVNKYLDKSYMLISEYQLYRSVERQRNRIKQLEVLSKGKLIEYSHSEYLLNERKRIQSERIAESQRIDANIARAIKSGLKMVEIWE